MIMFLNKIFTEVMENKKCANVYKILENIKCAINLKSLLWETHAHKFTYKHQYASLCKPTNYSYIKTLVQIFTMYTRNRHKLHVLTMAVCWMWQPPNFQA